MVRGRENNDLTEEVEKKREKRQRRVTGDRGHLQSVWESTVYVVEGGNGSWQTEPHISDLHKKLWGNCQIFTLISETRQMVLHGFHQPQGENTCSIRKEPFMGYWANPCKSVRLVPRDDVVVKTQTSLEQHVPLLVWDQILLEASLLCLYSQLSLYSVSLSTTQRVLHGFHGP